MALDPSLLQVAFGLAPEDAVAWFEAKGYKITGDWHEMRDAAHAQAFTVANVAKLDILQDIRAALDKALKEGKTERWFIQDLKPLLQKKGWWGREERISSETGEIRNLQQGSPERLRTIYRTNLQSAYMAGRWQLIEEARASHPYVQYVAIMDGRTRASHAAMNGRVFKVDDPIWRTHAPPNGLNCRCRLRPMTEAALAREGIEWSSSEGMLNEMDWPISARDPSLGTAPVTVYKAPGMSKGFAPDVGFNSNPGKDSPAWDVKGHLPDCGDVAAFSEGKSCIKKLPGQKTWKDYGRPDLRSVPLDLRSPAPQMLQAAQTRHEAAGILAASLGLSDAVQFRMVQTPVERMVMRNEWLPHLVDDELNARERYANFILPTLTDPFEVYLTAYEDGYRMRYIGLFTGKNDLLVVVRENKDGSLLWNIMQRDDRRMNAAREGALLYWKDQAGRTVSK